MSGALVWRPATRNDRQKIESFRCVPPGDEESVPPWVALIDRLIHAQKPPGRRERSYLLGIMGDELAALVIVDDLPDGPEFFHIAIVAVSFRFRGLGLRIGDAAIEEALHGVAEITQERKLSTAIVSANIHTANVASEQCFQRAGFTADPNRPRDGYRQWLIALEIED